MKKGFTLIELLAVIVILAIIALIATPIALDIINDAKISSVKSSMNNIEKALELYYYTNKSNNEIVFNCEDGVCKTENGNKLDVSGQLPSKGIMTISKKGKVTYDSVVLSGYMCDKINDEFTCSLASKNIVSSENNSIMINNNTSTNLNNYRMYGNSVQSKLPKEYQQLDYIESTGTQYINTGYIPKTTTVINADFMSKKQIGEAFTSLYGSQTSSGAGKRTYMLFGSSNNIQVCLSSSVIKFTGLGVDGNSTLGGIPTPSYWNNLRTNYILNILEKSVTIRDITWDLSNYYPQTLDGDLPIFLLTRNTQGVADANCSKGYLYGFTIYENNELVRNMIPCYRKSDNEIGMYDLVENKFYTNAGTGTFIKGNNAPTPDATIEIDSVGNKTKNLSDWRNLYFENVATGIILKSDDNGVVTLSGTPTNTSGSVITYMRDVDTSLLKVGQKYKLNVSCQIIMKDGTVNYLNTSFVFTEDMERVRLYIQRRLDNYVDGEIFKPYLYEDTATDEFEPYGKYKIPVTIVGKNLLDMSNSNGGTNNGVTAVINEDGSVSASGIATDAAINIWLLGGYFNQTELFNLPVGEYYVSGCRIFSYDGITRKTKTGYFSITEEEFPNGFSVTGVRFPQTTAGTDWNDVTIYPMIEFGTQKTEYEPYKEEIANIYLDEPLRKVGTYVDYIDFKSNKLVRNVGVLILTGEESWKEKDGIFYLEESIGVSSDKEISVSTHFTYEEESGFWIDDKHRINIIQEEVGSLEEFKEWLRNNNVTIHYPLKKSIVKEIELPKININKNKTYISVDTSVKPSKILLEYD